MSGAIGGSAKWTTLVIALSGIGHVRIVSASISANVYKGRTAAAASPQDGGCVINHGGVRPAVGRGWLVFQAKRGGATIGEPLGLRAPIGRRLGIGKIGQG